MSGVAGKYENQSQLLFVSSESGYETIGNQNHFRVNLNSMPFKNEDNTILRMSLKQFSLPKNFSNINKSNNSIRMFVKTFASQGITVPNLDTMVTIPEGDYVSHESLTDAFGKAIVAKLIEKVTGFTTSNLTAAAVTIVYRNKVVNSGIEQPLLGSEYNDFKLHIEITCSTGSFAWGQPLKFQCLNVPTSTVYNLDNGSGALGIVVSTTQLFNDSYILLGGKRIEEFQGDTTTPVYNITTPQTSFSSKAKNGATNKMVIASWYPMNSALHTNEYIYISSHQVHSQASSSLENVSNEHAHTFITSNILGKALRHINFDYSVSFRIDEPSPYFSNITSSFVNEIEIELRDHRGRPLSYPNVGNLPIGLSSNDYVAHTGDAQTKDGNTACDLTLLMEKFSNSNGVDSLRGLPEAPQIPNNNFQSNFSIPTRFCAN
tara:strand:- start:882 stop:2177 length:1296 start_codon:yes stop_codon:yes gene_type:complete